MPFSLSASELLHALFKPSFSLAPVHLDSISLYDVKRSAALRIDIRRIDVSLRTALVGLERSAGHPGCYGNMVLNGMSTVFSFAQLPQAHSIVPWIGSVS